MADMVDTSKPEKEAQSKFMAVQEKSEPIVVVDSDSDAEDEVEPQGTVAGSPRAESPLTEVEIANSQAETDGNVSGEESEK